MSNWAAAASVGKLGDKPWSSVTEVALAAAAKLKAADGDADRATQGRQGFQGRAALLRAEGRGRLVGQHVRRSARAG